jgi:hypothetical protein
LFVPMVSWRLAVDFFGMIAMACSGWGDNEASQHSDFDKISDLRGVGAYDAWVTDVGRSIDAPP